MKLNWSFLGGEGVQNKKPSVGRVSIFSGTAHYHVLVSHMFHTVYGKTFLLIINLIFILLLLVSLHFHAT